MPLLLLGSCADGAPATATLTIAGASTLQPAIEIAAERYEREHPGTRIDVQGGGSSVGITSPRSGLAQIGMVSRGLNDDERDLAATLIGHDGIALIVNSENPLTNLSANDVARIYSGEVTSWRDLGGADRPITVISKEEGRSTLELFEKHFGLKGKIVKSAVIIGPNGQAIATVAGNKDAVGYVSIGSAEVAVAEKTGIKAIALDGVTATVAHVKDGSFPLHRELTLTTKGKPEGLAADFIAWMLGAGGQAIMAEQGFVPLTPAAALVP